jgi:hypothetical protein
MEPRKKYAKPDKFRHVAEPTGQFRHKVTSKYMPHQGTAEKARRAAKAAKL